MYVNHSVHMTPPVTMANDSIILTRGIFYSLMGHFIQQSTTYRLKTENNHHMLILVLCFCNYNNKRLIKSVWVIFMWLLTWTYGDDKEQLTNQRSGNGGAKIRVQQCKEEYKDPNRISHTEAKCFGWSLQEVSFIMNSMWQEKSWIEFIYLNTSELLFNFEYFVIDNMYIIKKCFEMFL